MNKYQEVIQKARSDYGRRLAKHNKERLALEDKIQSLERWKEAVLMPIAKPATLRDYKRWFRGYVDRGGQDFVVRGRWSTRRDFFVLLADIEMCPLVGALSVSLIVPAGITVTGDAGHCDMFMMEGFVNRHGISAPIFEEM